MLGSLLTIVAVAWAVSPRFGAGGRLGRRLAAVQCFCRLAGFLMSFQQAMNGTATVHYGTPIAATLVNFIAGAPALGGLADQARRRGCRQPASRRVVVLPRRPHGLHLHWSAALLVRGLGVLVTGLGMIAGQLLGSLVWTLLPPPPGHRRAGHGAGNLCDPGGHCQWQRFRGRVQVKDPIVPSGGSRCSRSFMWAVTPSPAIQGRGTVPGAGVSLLGVDDDGQLTSVLASSNLGRGSGNDDDGGGGVRRR